MNSELLSVKTVNDILLAVKEAGRIILEAEGSRGKWDKNGVITKGGEAGENVNFVTEHDKKVQAFLFDRLYAILPEASFLGEEDDVKPENASKGFCFIVDPIDGTSNFIRGHGVSVISVGLFKDGKPFFGAVFDPYKNELFDAMKGNGARCNGKIIHVSDVPLEKSIIHFGTAPYYKEDFGELTVGIFRQLFYRAGDIRRFGSAALAMCAVAAGRSEALLEARLSPWDYAAGAVIVTEAGGIVTTFEGKSVLPDTPCSILASSKRCVNDLYSIISEITK